MRAAPDSEATGVVFNIQRYCVHDGEGIRTTVFLKGCPLRCRWCANPESQVLRPELGFNAGLCIGGETCGRCAEACDDGALARNAGAPLLDRNRCSACMACTDACAAGALHVQGVEKSVQDILDAVERDGVFFARSGGGLTLSGGEPFAQSRFALALLREARARRMDCAVETSGHTSWGVLSSACALLREICYDIKMIDPRKHAAQTGVGNALILKNFRRMAQEFPALDICVRTPVIPGVNDTEDDIDAILDFLAPFERVKYELLPYHRLGAQKYRLLDRPDTMSAAVLDATRFERLRALATRRRPAISATVAGRG